MCAHARWFHTSRAGLVCFSRKYVQTTRVRTRTTSLPSQRIEHDCSELGTHFLSGFAYALKRRPAGCRINNTTTRSFTIAPVCLRVNRQQPSVLSTTLTNKAPLGHCPDASRLPNRCLPGAARTPSRTPPARLPDAPRTLSGHPSRTQTVVILSRSSDAHYKSCGEGGEPANPYVHTYTHP